ncbi:MAG: hypothetical protein KZQ66_09405 [Candidatus Thiodiazotropha sp. (ex Lucinoma aequizonata)]|nr:hypothetical protein [Candidatus Thiodiazotropha sp. (ex Lucinoma aequizonata)]MCU7913064.1 hypothetical protein [Candidatus Thiodiazotropha sp. (ex Lucinoma aequizonata)]
MKKLITPAITALFLVMIPLSAKSIIYTHVTIIDGIEKIVKEIDPPETDRQRAYRNKFRSTKHVLTMPCHRDQKGTRFLQEGEKSYAPPEIT